MKTKLLLYCTKGKPYLFNRIIKGESDGYYTDIVPYDIEDEYLNGKIVAECECEVEEIVYEGVYENPISIFKSCRTKTLDCYDLNEKSCLNINNSELEHYLMPDLDENNDDKYFLNKVGYALHLSNIKAFKKPLELSDVYYKRCQYDVCSRCKSYEVCGNGFEIPLTKAPMNMMWVWYNGQKYCLISIRPEWLCKELNGEKPVEVRRKILKGMM